MHGDFTSMLCGGISALLLQMLHPLALAGVWDHSRFREDILGRLRRTSQFISATTFATTPDAERLIAKVQGIHQRIAGVDKDGTPYQASDPALLTRARRRVQSLYGFPPAPRRWSVLSAEDYFRESAEIARRLGPGYPQTPQEVADYLEAMRPRLRCDERTREVAEVLLSTRLGRMSQPVGRVMMNELTSCRNGRRRCWDCRSRRCSGARRA
ncbi:DUF2236 domain-containing protein [Klebsiella pneumoniae]|nr:DUF2236 domain-containing protein [Klebsiella pneumoniae]